MELSKHIPINFDVGDIVLLNSTNWDTNHINTLTYILEIDWRWETLTLFSFFYGEVTGAFKEVKLIKKNSNSLVKLIA